jgi:phosphate transport system permease protein
LWTGGLLGIFVVILILFFLIIESLPALRSIGITHFLFDSAWYPLEGQYNLLPMLVGSIYITFFAMLICLPLALGSAIYLVVYVNMFVQGVVFRLLEILAGIPSVIFGLWGMLTVVPVISQIEGPGTSAIAGAIIVAMMIIPALVLMFSYILQRKVESHYLQTVVLGLNKEQSILKVIVPASFSSLGGALILQTTRAIGETMAVLMVCGNIPQIPTNIFDSVRTLTTNTALEMAYATGEHRSSLFVSGLILVFFVALLLLAMKLAPHMKFSSKRQQAPLAFSI